MTCGIYMIKNKQTGQIYIGQSIDINKRYHYHCCYGNYTSSYIDRAINKYGMNNFELIILEELDNNKDGYYYRYRWRDGDKIQSICAPSLDKLERKVKREGYIWRKL